MQLWVGLGNVGAKYTKHRHNIGFRTIETLAEAYSFAAPTKKFQGLCYDGAIDGQRLHLLKPATYVNESGRSVRTAMDFYKLQPSDVVVFHDELDLALGKVKVKQGGGAAGHNGLRSIAAHIGDDFYRVRIGIGHPGHKDKVSGHVLGDFSKSEPVAEILAAISREASWLAHRDSVRFMNEVALRLSDTLPDSQSAM